MFPIVQVLLVVSFEINIGVCGIEHFFHFFLEYSNSYITDYNCQTDDKIFTHESFPSGHSAMSAFITVFCVQYIQVKWVTSSNSPLRLWKHIFEAVVATAFFWITITRYTDNMHHPIDIIVGYAIGAVFALFTVVNNNVFHGY